MAAPAALFMAPMAKKKTVTAKYDPNTYRVISHEAECLPFERTTYLATFTSPPDTNLMGQPADLQAAGEHRHNRPNPRNVGFLRQDVKLLNEPVCDVRTLDTQTEQHRWWPHRTSNEPLVAPPHTLDTTVRGDFQYRGDEVEKPTRHDRNPDTPILGAVPVNFLRKPDGKQRFWKEGMSYEHQYNCRLEPQYPIRGKRHGSFVWNEFPPYEVDRMLRSYGYISDKIGQTDKELPTAQQCSAQASRDASRKSSVHSQTHSHRTASESSQTSDLPPVAM